MATVSRERLVLVLLCCRGVAEYWTVAEVPIAAGIVGHHVRIGSLISGQPHFI